MPKGFSLHIGISELGNHYRGEGLEEMPSAIHDAESMLAIMPAGFENNKKLLLKATTTQVKNEICRFVEGKEKLVSGDILVITYAGHGGSVPDKYNIEIDGFNETWCLSDKPLLDDELLELWTKFEAGVRILVISDSCNSGTVIQKFNPEIKWEKFRTLSPETMKLTYLENKEYYDEKRIKVQNNLLETLETNKKNDFNGLVKASVLLLSACQDGGFAELDSNSNCGLFTANLIESINEDDPANYLELHKAIFNRIKKIQQPNYYKIGVPCPDFELQKPFTI